MKTINDLGLEPSFQYARHQEQLDLELLRDSSYVSKQSQVDVTSPFYSSEYELLFEVDRRNKNWADFFSPPYYNDQKKRIFTFQIAPSLGSDEALQVYVEKIHEKVERDKKDQDQKKKRQRPENEWEEDISIHEEEKESKILLKLLENIGILDKILIEINSKRNQYQRG